LQANICLQFRRPLHFLNNNHIIACWQVLKVQQSNEIFSYSASGPYIAKHKTTFPSYFMVLWAKNFFILSKDVGWNLPFEFIFFIFSFLTLIIGECQYLEQTFFFCPLSTFVEKFAFCGCIWQKKKWRLFSRLSYFNVKPFKSGYNFFGF